MQTFYRDWGFRDCPFNHEALLPNEVGAKLLVGREKEISQVRLRLLRPGKITCIEGTFGAGKTSLVNISAYKSLVDFRSGANSQALISCKDSFQLDPQINAQKFIVQVYRQVAKSLLARRDDLVSKGLQMDATAEIATLLASSVHGNQENEEAFVERILECLGKIFQEGQAGGVVCVIDNLELLETAAQARTILEQLRDRLFVVRELRWVFCGARGIVSSLIASQRLNGFLARPIVGLGPIPVKAIHEVFNTRITEYSIANKTNKLPLSSENFARLYVILNHNLRDLLSRVDGYCMYVHEEKIKWDISDKTRERAFEAWLSHEAFSEYEAALKLIPELSWLILDTIMSNKFKGDFGIGEIPEIIKNIPEVFKGTTFDRYLKILLSNGIVTDMFEVDDSSGTEKSKLYRVSSKGALVHYARLMSDRTRTLATADWLNWLRTSSTSDQSGRND